MKKRTSVIVVSMLLFCVLLIVQIPVSMALSFQFGTEIVNVGTTAQFDQSHVQDGSFERLIESDTASDGTTTANVETIFNGTKLSGTFPDDIQSNNEQYINYLESDEGGAIPEYHVDVFMEIESIPSGDSYQLNVDGKIDNENVGVYAYDNVGDDWNLKGTLTSTFDQLIQVGITGDEISGGQVILNFTDESGGDAIQSNLWLDYVAVVNLLYDWELSVDRITSGVIGTNHELEIWGRIGIDMENYDVDIYNFTAVGWNLARWDSPFDQFNTEYNVHLVSDEISNGQVKVRFRDDTPTDNVQGEFWLDSLLLITDNNPPTIDDPITEEHWLSGTDYDHQWNSSDADNQTHTWTLAYSPDDPVLAWLSIVSSNRTATVSGNCPAGDIGKSWTAWTNVSDGTASDSDQWTLYCVNATGDTGMGGSPFWMSVNYGWEKTGLNTFEFRAEIKTNVLDPKVDCEWLIQGERIIHCNFTHTFDLVLMESYDVQLTVDNGYWTQTYNDDVSQNNVPIFLGIGFVLILLAIAISEMSRKRTVREWTEE